MAALASFHAEKCYDCSMHMQQCLPVPDPYTFVFVYLREFREGLKISRNGILPYLLVGCFFCCPAKGIKSLKVEKHLPFSSCN